MLTFDFLLPPRQLPLDLGRRGRPSAGESSEICRPCLLSTEYYRRLMISRQIPFPFLSSLGIITDPVTTCCTTETFFSSAPEEDASPALRIIVSYLFPDTRCHYQTVKGMNLMPPGRSHNFSIHSRPHEGWHREQKSPTSRSSAALTAVGCIHLFSTVLGGVASVQIDCWHSQRDAAESVSRTFPKRSSKSWICGVGPRSCHHFFCHTIFFFSFDLSVPYFCFFLCRHFPSFSFNLLTPYRPQAACGLVSQSYFSHSFYAVRRMPSDPPDPRPRLYPPPCTSHMLFHYSFSLLLFSPQPLACSERQLSSLQHASIHRHATPPQPPGRQTPFLIFLGFLLPLSLSLNFFTL